MSPHLAGQARAAGPPRPAAGSVAARYTEVEDEGGRYGEIKTSFSEARGSRAPRAARAEGRHCVRARPPSAALFALGLLCWPAADCPMSPRASRGASHARALCFSPTRKAAASCSQGRNFAAASSPPRRTEALIERAAIKPRLETR